MKGKTATAMNTGTREQRMTTLALVVRRGRACRSSGGLSAVIGSALPLTRRPGRLGLPLPAPRQLDLPIGQQGGRADGESGKILHGDEGAVGHPAGEHQEGRVHAPDHRRAHADQDQSGEHAPRQQPAQPGKAAQGGEELGGHAAGRIEQGQAADPPDRRSGRFGRAGDDRRSPSRARSSCAPPWPTSRRRPSPPGRRERRPRRDRRGSRRRSSCRHRLSVSPVPPGTRRASTRTGARRW